MLKRPPRDRVVTIAMVLFAVGLVALAAMVVLFATGHRNLPLWLSMAAMLLPLGFAIGAVHTVRQWRRTGDPAESDEAAQAEPAEPAGRPDADASDAEKQNAS